MLYSCEFVTDWSPRQSWGTVEAPEPSGKQMPIRMRPLFGSGATPDVAGLSLVRILTPGSPCLRLSVISIRFPVSLSNNSSNVNFLLRAGGRHLFPITFPDSRL